MLKIAHITDLHLGEPGETYLDLDLRQRFLAALEAAVREEPDAYVLGGDYSLHDPDAQACHWLREQMDQLGKPYFLIAGNHDDSHQLCHIFELQTVQPGHLYYTFQMGGFQHIVLDTSTGSVDEQQLYWFAAQLRQAEKPLIWMHHPPTLVGTSFMDQRHALKNRADLREIMLEDGRPLSIICGHYHGSLQLNADRLSIHIAPPTSFYIDPFAETFEQEFCPPGFQLVVAGEHGVLVVPKYA